MDPDEGHLVESLSFQRPPSNTISLFCTLFKLIQFVVFSKPTRLLLWLVKPLELAVFWRHPAGLEERYVTLGPTLMNEDLTYVHLYLNVLSDTKYTLILTQCKGKPAL